MSEIAPIGLRLAAWAALVPMTLVSIWIWAGWSRPSFTLAFTGFQMVVLAPAWLILAGAIVGRQWAMAVVALLVAVSHLAFSLPAATKDRVPAWVADAPSFTVFAANVKYANDRQDEVADLVRRIDADVVVLNEMTDPQHAALDAAGVLERYGTEQYGRGMPFGEMLLTRLPIVDAWVENLGGSRVPAAKVLVDDLDVLVYGVHVHAPKANQNRRLWRRNLDALGATVERIGSPAVMAGDFNSAPWHGPYRDLLARGLTDTHDALGQGLSRSWTPHVPVVGWFGPIMRIDHALFTDGLFPRRVRDVEIPGSDHRGLVVEMAVRR